MVDERPLDLGRKVTGGKPAKTVAKRLDRLLQRSRLVRLAALALCALRIRQVAVLCRLGFQAQALDRIVAEHGDGSCHLADLVAAIKAVNLFCRIACSQGFHTSAKASHGRSNAGLSHEYGNGHRKQETKADADRTDQDRVAHRCGQCLVAVDDDFRHRLVVGS